MINRRAEVKGARGPRTRKVAFRFFESAMCAPTPSVAESGPVSIATFAMPPCGGRALGGRRGDCGKLHRPEESSRAAASFSGHATPAGYCRNPDEAVRHGNAEEIPGRDDPCGAGR